MKGKTMAPAEAAGGGLRPWHLLLVGALASATAGAVVGSSSGTINAVLVVVSILSAALVAVGVFRTLGPFLGTEVDEPSDMRAGRTRAALEREKMLVLRSIKEVEFDRAMGKISEADFQDMSGRLRQRAIGLIRQLDGDSGYRTLIQRELARLAGSPRAPEDLGAPVSAAAKTAAVECPSCRTPNDSDARFCKGCGTPLAGRRS